MDADAGRRSRHARFARLLARPDDAIGLAEGALLISEAERPGLDPAPSLAMLDLLAERVRTRLDRGDGPPVVLDRLRDVVYDEVGFRGASPAEARDAACGRLDVVLRRRVGLPILLAIVLLEIADRIALPLDGIGMPGHFLVGGPDRSVLDPADRARRLTPDDCQALLRRAFGERVLFHAGMLRPSAHRDVLARVLRNLRSTHLDARNWPAALEVVELLAVAEPDRPEHGRDRGLLLGRTGRFSEGIAGLGHYLDERPEAADAEEVRRVLGVLRGRRN